MENMASVAKRVGYLLYAVDRNTTTFETAEEVPSFINQAFPVFFALIILEYLINWAMGKPVFRTNDGLTSCGHGFVMETTKLLTRGIELAGYTWLYERRFLNPSWDSPWVWWAAAIGSDLAYYWVHRIAHEVNFFWSGHQVHHSSEDYNLTTALRQSAYQKYFSFGFYHPLALLGVPLPAILVHVQFNLIYQFWIHTEVVKTLGPLEWVFNTPSHHRVHHGVNKWCLDKNYAGVLIIWDRIFGTFEPERENEKIVYGLVSQPQTFNVFYLQHFYFPYVVRKALRMDSWRNTLKGLFYGPGWSPGAPRLGDPNHLPNIKAPRKKYDPKLPTLLQFYFVVHFFVFLVVQQVYVQKFATFTWLTALMYMVFIVASFTVSGAMFDGAPWAPLLEVLRCGAYVIYFRSRDLTGIWGVDVVLLYYFAVCTFIWVNWSMKTLTSGKALKFE
ncbi:alkylglycerol monooxygenase-like [Oratosquilla oratoria]|uniref:alkylglycerol monooxygenase-like n=1 Tax=Oratosquilla oratoria TaxID=337810 RepID=UPI003F76F84D